MQSKSAQSASSASRRNFLKNGAATVSAAALVPTALASRAYAQGSGQLKVGLIGCGGRGTGAAGQALTADSNTELVAMADVFEDQLDRSLRNLQSNKTFGDRVRVPKEQQFVGFDGYKNVIEASDVVILTTTPHFRPQQLREAIESGKHVFCEKPVAVDAPGVRSVLETTELAKAKGLSLVSGLCWRYHAGMRATFDQIHNGAIGDITAMQCSYNSGGVWDPRRRREQCKSEMEYQIRNWYYYTWLSGDFNVEQHVHSLDKMAWAMKDEVPVKVSGNGGRIQRTDPKYGNIYDHFSITYEYPNDVNCHVEWRQFLNSHQFTGDTIYGTKGVAKFGTSSASITGENAWNWRKPRTPKSMYDLEHEEFFAAIRSGERKDDAEWIAHSTTMAILGRTACYSGKRITWEDMWNAEQRLVPENIDINGELPIRPLRIPGVPETQDTVFPTDTQKA